MVIKFGSGVQGVSMTIPKRHDSLQYFYPR